MPPALRCGAAGDEHAGRAGSPRPHTQATHITLLTLRWMWPVHWHVAVLVANPTATRRPRGAPLRRAALTGLGRRRKAGKVSHDTLNVYLLIR